MFREPEDNAVAVGWPWHGLIVDNVLTLPSGRTMPCETFSNNTWLWDIGLPDPGIVPDDPDELWLSKAIIRGVTSTRFYSGGGGEYGLLEYRLSPILVDGVRRIADQHEILGENPAAPDIGVGVRVRIDGVAYTSNRLRWPDIGMPEKADYLNGTFLDVGHDGTRWIISISNGVGVQAYGEAVLASSGSGYALELSVLATYEQVYQWDTTLDEPYVVPLNMWLASLAGGEITNAADSPGMTYYTPTGEYSAHAIGSKVAGAWYGLDGAASLVRLHIDAVTEYTGTYGGTPLETGHEVHRGQLWLSSGEAETGKMAFKTERLVENIEGVGSEVTITYTLDGQERVLEYSYPYFQSIGAGAGLENPRHAWAGGIYSSAANLTNDLHAFQGDGAPIPVCLPIGTAWLSNKLVQPLAILERADSSEYYYCGDALSPHGLDAGVVVHDTAVDPLPSFFIYGSYNPITGQVLRNQVDGHAYSWV